jgi:hypothetical protein
MAVGYEQGGKIYHTLPPRPPLSLDVIYLCEDKDMARFTSAGRFGYFRHILHNKDVPVAEVVAAHLEEASRAHGKNGAIWKENAIHGLITLLRDDYSTLMSVIGVLSEVS